MKRAALLATAAALVLTGCSTTDSASTTATGEGAQEEFLNTVGLAGMDAREIIDHLDRQPVAERPTDLIASVQPDELVLTGQDQAVVLDLPADLTYVSIAPYITQTHDCFYHSLTTCLGELGNEPVHVTFTDETTGDTLVDEQVTTFDNGFVGFWVPSEATGTIEVNYQERSGVTEFSTTDDGATCVTDLRLT